MAEAVGLAASIIAVIEISARVISHSRKLIRAVKTAPHELHLIHIETLTLSGILHSLQSLHDSDSIPPQSLEKLQGWNGLVDICRRTLVDLDKILVPLAGEENARLDILRVPLERISMTLKANRAKKLIDDVRRFTDLIKVALLDNFQHHISRNTDSLNAISRTVTDVQTKLEVKQLDDLLHWISPLNPSYRQSYLNALEKRFRNTGDWLLKTTQHDEWLCDAQNSCLCVSGPTGSGKTVLSAVVLQSLQQQFRNSGKMTGTCVDIEPCILYYYFDMRDAYKNTTAGLYDSLVRQLLQYYPFGYTSVLELAMETHRMHPTPEEYIELIKSLIQAVLATSAVFLVVDGCGKVECSDFESLRNLLCDIKGCSWPRNSSEAATLLEETPDEIRKDVPASQPFSAAHGYLKLFITTREPTSIRQLWDVNVSITDYPVVEDIKSYVRGQIYGMSDAAKAAMGDTLLRKIANVIVGQSGGLFIHATLHVGRVIQLETVDDVKQAMADLPGRSDDTYAVILRDIINRYPGERNTKILTNMFIWLCQAKYCLSVAEFSAVTTVEIRDNRIHKGSIPWDPETFCLRLGPLLNIDRRPRPPEINLPHATAEEFLQGPLRDIEELSQFHVSPPEAQKFLAEFCIRFLGCDDFATPLSAPDAVGDINPFKRIPGGLGVPLDPNKDPWIGPMQQRLESYHGLEYTSINWHHHLRNASRGRNTAWMCDTIVPLLGWFLDKDNPRYRSWCEAHAYFCHELEESCRCESWREPQYFLDQFGLPFLQPYVRGRNMPIILEEEFDGAEDDDRPDTALCTCSGSGMAISPYERPGEEADEGAELVEPTRESECSVCRGSDTAESEIGSSRCVGQPKPQCGRSFKLFQKPGNKWRAMMDLKRFSVDGHTG